MKGFIVVALVVCPVAAYAQQTYTNADLARFQVPGAYTNDDLKRLPPAVTQKIPAAAAPWVQEPAPRSEQQSAFDSLARTRRLLAAELAFELDRIAASESAFAGSADRLEARAGYRARARDLVLELQKRLVLVDSEIEATLHAARRAGVPIDRGSLTW